MLTNEVPDASAGTADDRAPRRRKRRMVVIGTVAAVFLAFCGLTARLFIFPASGMPARVDAIVMMAGPGDRFRTALRLASQHRAPVLVLSSGDRGPNGSGRTPAGPAGRRSRGCGRSASTPTRTPPRARPSTRPGWPGSTTGTPSRWSPSRPQDSRARLRMERCFSGHVYVMTAPTPAKYWPYELAYEWAATIKALTINRSC